MKERIRQLRKTLKLNQSDFGKKVGVKGNTIGNYELGLRSPSEAVIFSICREFNVNEQWLRNGNGEMFKKPSNEIGYYVEDLLEYNGQGNPLYDIIIEMMKKYHDLDEKSQTVIRNYFKNISDSIANKKKED